jgi:hypothetical protein
MIRIRLPRSPGRGQTKRNPNRGSRILARSTVGVIRRTVKEQQMHWTEGREAKKKSIIPLL